MNVRNASRAALSVILGAAVWGLSPVSRPAPLQAASAQAAADRAAPRDQYQRSLEIYEFKASAKSGPQRGEELYYYKCWFCHNQFAKRAPLLKDLYKRPNMTDLTVAEKVLKGGPGMPSYGTALNEADIADLLSYLRGEKCCWEGEEPPPNPRYRAGANR